MVSIMMRSILLCLLLVPLTASAQEKDRYEEIGHLGLLRVRAQWPSPESLVRNLRSENEDVRLKALHLVGVPDLLIHRAVYAPDPSAKVIGSAVRRPELIELRYASLADDSSEQAILAVQIADRTYAAVALPR